MNYHNITHIDQNNGDGLRVVLWVSGCSHHCYKCQNPQTWNPESGILFDEEARKEIFQELDQDYISGITFSGGDPLYEGNVKEVYNLIEDIRNKYPNKTIWLYSGYTWEDIFSGNILALENKDIVQIRRSIILNVDVFIDGEYIESERDITLQWRGSKNQRVIDVKETLKNGHIFLWCE